MSQFAVKEILWDPAVIHSQNMAKPAQTSLSQWCIQVRNFRSFQDCVVWNIALPGDVEYALDTSHVESVKLLFLSWVKSPGLVAAQHCAQNAGSVDLDLGTFRQLLVGPYSQGAARLKAGGSCPIKCENLSQQWKQPLASCSAPIEQETYKR